MGAIDRCIHRTVRSVRAMIVGLIDRIDMIVRSVRAMDRWIDRSN